MKKIRVSSEVVYALGAVILSFATAVLAAADFGMSMVVAPAYIVSLKVSFLTFGQAEYVVQGMWFILFCILVRKVRPLYLFSFFSGFLYGLILDFWRMLIPQLNPEVCAPGSFSMPVRIAYFAVGFFLNSFGVTLYFKSYFYPQVYEFFVKGISGRLGVALPKFKICFDVTCLTIALVLSFALFRRIVGIGAGTLIMAACNGLMIGFCGKMIDRYVEIYPAWERFSKKFEL